MLKYCTRLYTSLLFVEVRCYSESRLLTDIVIRFLKFHVTSTLDRVACLRLALTAHQV